MEEEENSEEVASLFAVLPFANEVESETEEDCEALGEKDEGMVIELSQTGPPTRKLKPPIVTIGMQKNICVYVHSGISILN